MAFQTGTVTNLNDLLDVFATWLASIGWTIDGNWLEPMTMSVGSFSGPGGTEPSYNWRWARRIHAHKGAVFISIQDFYITKDFFMGTQGTSSAGPGLCAIISTSISAQPATLPAAAYNSVGPVQGLDFNQPGSPGSVNGIIRTVIMPLPQIHDQASGEWHASAHVMNEPVAGLPAPFGIPAGALVPCPYWFMSDAAGDNVIMVVVRNGDLDYISKTPYLYFGSMPNKGGAWTGGPYVGASHGNNFAFVSSDTFRANRWGPPGAMSDGISCHTIMALEYDSYVGAPKYAAIVTTADNNIRTARQFSSTAIMRPKNELGDPTSVVLGLVQNGVHYGTLRLRKSTLAQAAPLLPVYWVVQRDNGLYSMLGAHNIIFQAYTYGFAPGTEWVDKAGSTFVVFDDFAVLKVP